MGEADVADLAWLQSQFPNLNRITPLAAGGQKQVFTAEHPTEGPVVLKILHGPSFNVEEIRREVLSVQKVNHPRVPLVYEVGLLNTTLGQHVWFRERRIDGECLRPIIQRGPMPVHSVLRVGLHVLEVLEEVAKAQLVHRDIKPENLIQDTTGSYCVIDFGLARHLDLASLTADHAPHGKGTFGYSAPEQMRNDKRAIDGRADLFALGVTLYECATGTNPFTNGVAGWNHAERQRRAENDPLPRCLLGISPAGQRDFADLLSAMTQKRRDQRISSAQEARSWLTSICVSEGIT
jgi:serine/threonine protein kinase